MKVVYPESEEYLRDGPRYGRRRGEDMKSWETVKREAKEFFGIRMLVLHEAYYAVFITDDDTIRTVPLGEERLPERFLAEALTAFLREWVYLDEDEKEVCLILRTLETRLLAVGWSLTLGDYWATVERISNDEEGSDSRYFVPLSRQGILELCDFVNDLSSNNVEIDMANYPLFSEIE